MTLAALRPIRVSLHWLLAGAALAAGGLIAYWPLTSSLAVFGGLTLLGMALWEPALALGAAMALGPTRAYLAAAGYAGLQFDLGQIFFAVAVAGWLARGALRREIYVPRLGLLLPLGVYCFVGALSLFGAADWLAGLNELIKWLEVGVVLIIAYSEAQRGRARWLVAAMLLAGLAQAGVGIWQYGFRGLGPKSFALPGGFYRAYGSFEQPNPFGGFLGLIWPLAAGLAIGYLPRWRQLKTRRLLWAAGCALSAGVLLLGLYVSFSRGAWLGAAAAALALAAALPRRRGLGVGLVTAGLAAAWLVISAGWLPASVVARLANVADFTTVADVRGLNINDANFAIVERLAHWQAAENMIEAHPWLGVGWGNYPSAYPQYRLLNWPIDLGHAHNIYLHVWAETGALGLAAYVVFWLSAIILTLRQIQRTDGVRRGLALGLLGVWVHLLTHQIVDNLHVNNINLLLATQLGVLYALDRYPDDAHAPAA